MRKALFALAALMALPVAAETVAITGGRVVTLGPAGTIDGATVVIRDGKIAAVGRDVAVPNGARRIDAAGKIVTPGLMDSLSQIGVVEVDAVEATQDSATEDDRITAAFNVADAINPRSMVIPVNRIEGLTRAVVAPRARASLIAGQAVVIHLGGPGDYLVKSPVAMFGVLGERGMRFGGGSRAAALLRLREILQDARDFNENQKSYERGERRDYILSRLDLEALQPVIRGELPLVLTVNRASDIQTVLRIAKEEKLKIILAGVSEAWEVAEDIAAAKVPVLINPMENLPDSFESIGATLENAARLHRAGVTFAFMTRDAHNSRNIRQNAGIAVANGLPWDAALAAMTAVPARLWGLADRYGTLEPGKDADVVVWDGDPLEVTSFPEAVFIRGVQIPMESRQLELRDRYKDVGGTQPHAYRNP
ncbi:MAG TPA: amidohydrolase family protein [Thermoanaerobaculia bacterium]|nr:amidohydrolase family protein [Thermoanaerobaculia bacterium]